MIEFSKSKCPNGAETLATDRSPHEVLRKAIACCNGEDSITLSLDAATALILEWDKLKDATN